MLPCLNFVKEFCCILSPFTTLYFSQVQPTPGETRHENEVCIERKLDNHQRPACKGQGTKRLSRFNLALRGPVPTDRDRPFLADFY
jgi:hypothetical protein